MNDELDLRGEPDEVTPLNSSAEDAIDYNVIFQGRDKRENFVKKSTVIGEFRNPKRFTWIQWVFLVVSTFSMIAVFALNIERFVTFEKSYYNVSFPGNSIDCSKWYCTTDFTFTVLLLVNLVFCVFYCYDGLFRERKFELMAFVAATIIIVIYIVGNYIFLSARGYEISTVKKVKLILVCILGPINIALALLSLWKMGYLVFSVIGSNKKLKNAYDLRSFFTTLQYFHVEIMANIVVLVFVQDGALISTAEKVILPILFILLFAVTFLGSMAILWEVAIGVYIWYCLILPYDAYYIYKLIEVSINWSKYIEYEEYFTDGTFESSSLVFVAVTLIIVVCLGLLACSTLVVCMVFVLRNFNIGLKDRVHLPFQWCNGVISSIIQRR